MSGVISREYASDLTLAVILSCSFMIVVDTTVVNIALPTIQGDLHISPTNLSWVIDAYTLAYGGLLLLGGRTGGILGRRQTFVAGLAIFTLASLLGGLAPNVSWLIAARALQGMGAAFAGPNAIALIVTNFAEGGPRSRALGIYAMVASTGAIVGLILGGILIAGFSWRSALFINVPIGASVVFLAPRLVKESPRSPGYLDLPGALAGTGGVVVLVYGFIRAASNGWNDRFTLGSFALASALLALFVFIELRSKQPIVPLHIFVESNRAGGYLSMLLVAATMFSILFFLTQFLQEILAFSPLVAGLAFLPWMLTIFAVARVVPRLIPRFGMKRIITVGAIFLIAAMLWISQITATSKYLTGILGPMALFGIGIGSTFLPLNMLILANVRPQDSGAAGSVLQTMTQVGGSLGLAILVAVFGNTLRSSTAQVMPTVNPLLQMRVTLAHAIASAFGVGTFFAVGIGVVATLTIAAQSRRGSVLSHRPGGEAARRRRPSSPAVSR